MSEQLRDQVMRLIVDWQSGRAILADAVGGICDLVDSSNVDDIAAMLPEDMREFFASNAKACAAGRGWYYIGSDAHLVDSPHGPPFPEDAVTALKDWHLRMRK